MNLPSVVTDMALNVVNSSLNRVGSLLHRPSGEKYPHVDEALEDHKIKGIIDDGHQRLKLGLPLDDIVQKLGALVDALIASKTGRGLDDRKLLLEDVLVFLSRLPAGSAIARELQDKVISILWYDLAHPPASIVGQKRQFRSPDGSGTSIWDPEMGKAGSEYARSVQNIHPLPPNQLPSPEILFDVLLKKEKQVDHPAGLSSHFFAFANLVIHSLFWTDLSASDSEPKNKVSSYLDLSPLYGSSEADISEIRLHDGTGRIYPDTFSDPRLLNMPPSTPALLVLFSRNHNYIAQKILEINERGLYTNPPPTGADEKKKQDDYIFNTARLVNCGWFISTIFGDYLASILGFVREANSWSLDPLSSFRADSHELVDRGSGNVVSVEFLALYHFHSSIAAADEKWLEEQVRARGGGSWETMSASAFKEVLSRQRSAIREPPHKRVFGNMTRQADGSFKDEELAAILQQATKNPASAFKARGTPAIMRPIELLAIQQNRDWGVCSLNEFRKFLGLKPHSSFEEWAGEDRPDIAAAAKKLYHHPDNIELYVGLQAEASKKPVPGAGLCPGYTISRAILADAVALVRGDRFFTNDFTAYNLTAWGIKDCTRDPNNSANGGMLGKLFLRTLPNHYTPDSSYTNFPFMVPSALEGYFKELNIAHKYNFSRPLPLKVAQTVVNHQEVLGIISNPSFASDVPTNAAKVLPGSGYLAAYDQQGQKAVDRRAILDSFSQPAFVKDQVGYLATLTNTLLRERAMTLVGGKMRSINIVREVVNYLPIHFVCDYVLGLPLKTEDNPHGVIVEDDLRSQFLELYDYVFLDSNPSTKVAKQEVVRKYADALHRVVEGQLLVISTAKIPLIGLVGAVYDWVTQYPKPAKSWLSRLSNSSRNETNETIANDAVALSIILSVELSQALANVIDAFLDDSIRQEIVALARSHDSSSAARLKSYIAEALRLAPPVPGTYRTAERGVKSKGGVQHSKGDRVYVSFTEAGVDPITFGDDADTLPLPETVFSGELVRLLGAEWLVGAILPVVKVVFNLKNIERVPGPSGHLVSFTQLVEGTKVKSFLNSEQQITPWASDLLITYAA